MQLLCPQCQAVYDDATLQRCPDDDSLLFAVRAEGDDPLLGEIVDERFRIEAPIGKGGMGAVYRATQLSVGRAVALKVLRPEMLDRPEMLERFYRESKIIAGLTHPNIVRLIEFGQDRERGLLYLVMELLEGVELGALLARGRLRLPLAIEIAYQVAGALTEPHASGVVHRDLKPDNLLLIPISDGSLCVKVLDFGIARALEADTQITATGMVCGTPRYMAPEQAQNMEVGPAADLYALGVILYEMLCGLPPFAGANSLQIMLQQIKSDPDPLPDYLPPSDLPPQVDALVRGLLRKQPQGRPRSAREVRAQLERIRAACRVPAAHLPEGARGEDAFDGYVLERARRSEVEEIAHPAEPEIESGQPPSADIALSETLLERGAASLGSLSEPLDEEFEEPREASATRPTRLLMAAAAAIALAVGAAASFIAWRVFEAPEQNALDENTPPPLQIAAPAPPIVRPSSAPPLPKPAPVLDLKRRADRDAPLPVSDPPRGADQDPRARPPRPAPPPPKPAPPEPASPAAPKTKPDQATPPPSADVLPLVEPRERAPKSNNLDEILDGRGRERDHEKLIKDHLDL